MFSTWRVFAKAYTTYITYTVQICNVRLNISTGAFFFRIMRSHVLCSRTGGLPLIDSKFFVTLNLYKSEQQKIHLNQFL